MKSLQEFISESVENLQETDKIVTIGGLGPRAKKTPSGKKVIWTNTMSLPGMHIPGKGYLPNQKLETFRDSVMLGVMDVLDIPMSETYDLRGISDHNKECYCVDVHVQGIYDAKNIKDVKKQERALDYAVGISIGVPKYALNKFDESGMKKSLADFFGISEQDIVSEVSQVHEPHPDAVHLISQAYSFTAYMTYDEFAAFAATVK